MGIQVALQHKTTYLYDRDVQLGPQIVRLRPAPHCRTPILSYSMKVEPENHFCNWQQDPQGNYLARLVFPQRTDRFSIHIDLIADLTAINPFDFFLESYAETFPFRYENWQQTELAPYLKQIDSPDEISAIDSWLSQHNLVTQSSTELRTIDHVTNLNRLLEQDIKYAIRLEPGVQTPKQTLELRTGSCRDSAWLLVQILRRLGLAARFASGYLIQLKADIEEIAGPSGPKEDFTDLHAWAEVYLPGAGWIGLDPTSGLLCGEGHLPVACAPDPVSAAPVSGLVEPAECQFEFSMSVHRLVEDPRSTKPYTDDQWNRIYNLGLQVDKRLQEDDVRLTFGGEPTFVSMDDRESPEWNTDAVGEKKRKVSALLIKKLREAFAPGAFLHYGQGKWYPGESLPRWALTCMWRKDGQPIWNNSDWIADETRDYGFRLEHAKKFATRLAEKLGVEPKWLLPAYEDTYYFLWREQRLPIDVEPGDPKLADPEERSRIARVFSRGLDQPVGLILPIRRQWWQARGDQTQGKWASGPWPIRPEKLFLLPGDSAIGLRLPLDTLPHSFTLQNDAIVPADPFGIRPSLPSPAEILGQQQARSQKLEAAIEADRSERKSIETSLDASLHSDQPDTGFGNGEPRTEPKDQSIRTALCVEPRDGRLYLFMPPTETLEDYLDLLAAAEQTCNELKMPIVIEGYLPPSDHRVDLIKVTPDPGVIEVNVQPSTDWKELVENTNILYDQARRCRLTTEKFDLDGKHTGTGGGNHIVMGAGKPLDSPFLRAPHVLRSLITFWVNHPSLSYMFSGRFIGPTSQAPRVDEGRHDAVYELQTALELLPSRGESCPPWLVDRVLRNLLIDLTGNTHRAEICIDKLYSPDSSTGRLGLVELRGFEMPPHPQMSLATQLLIRNLIAVFWRHEYQAPLARWGNALHDRFMLPHYVWEDFRSVLLFLQSEGWNWEDSWFVSHFEFRFPRIGGIELSGVSLELRTAIEPWYVLGEEGGGGGTVRYVDSSVERLEVKANGLDPTRHRVLCNGIQVPLQPTGSPNSYVCGVRYRAWQPPSCLHPTIPVHSPLVIELWDTAAGRSLGGCTYHVSHPGGRNHETFPVNALEAEGRRNVRFSKFGHTPGVHFPRMARHNPEMPTTLDLRRERPSR